MFIPKKAKVSRARTRVGAHFASNQHKYGADWSDLRVQTAKSQKWKCFDCGARLKGPLYPEGKAWECHHRKSLGSNGSNGANNRAAICVACHERHHDHYTSRR